MLGERGAVVKPGEELLDRLADEYALGMLRGGARRRFERWMQDRPALRERVERMQGRQAPLASRLPAASAPAQTWERIEQRLFGAAPSPEVARRGWFWRFAAVWATVASVALLTLGGLLLLAPERLVSPETLALRTQQVPAAYIAVLSDSHGRPALVASAARHATLMDLKVLRPTPATPGTQWLLWGHTAQGERVALDPSTSPPARASSSPARRSRRCRSWQRCRSAPSPPTRRRPGRPPSRCCTGLASRCGESLSRRRSDRRVAPYIEPCQERYGPFRWRLTMHFDHKPELAKLLMCAALAASAQLAQAADYGSPGPNDKLAPVRTQIAAKQWPAPSRS